MTTSLGAAADGRARQPGHASAQQLVLRGRRLRAHADEGGQRVRLGQGDDAVDGVQGAAHHRRAAAADIVQAEQLRRRRDALGQAQELRVGQGDQVLRVVELRLIQEGRRQRIDPGRRTAEDGALMVRVQAIEAVARVVQHWLGVNVAARRQLEIRQRGQHAHVLALAGQDSQLARSHFGSLRSYAYPDLSGIFHPQEIVTLP